MPKILIVEDEERIASVVAAYLEREGFQVFTAGNGRAAMTLFRETEPDAVILDLMLPDFPGGEVCRMIREVSETPVLMLTAKSAEEHRLEGFGLGADDYITKPFSPRELVARLKAVLRRANKRNASAPMVFGDGDLAVDEERHQVIRAGRPITLTATEFKLLVTLASNPGRVFSRLELVNRVQGYDFDGYERTVDAHMKNLRQKLGEDPKNPRYLQTVFGVGYKFGGDGHV